MYCQKQPSNWFVTFPHTCVEPISRWAVDRYRNRIQLYGVGYMKEVFSTFVREKAVVIHIYSTPMRLSTSGFGNTKASKCMLDSLWHAQPTGKK